MLRIATIGQMNFPAAISTELQALACAGDLHHTDPELMLISTTERLDAEMIKSFPSLRHVVVCGTSLGRLDLDALQARHISVDNVTNYGDHPAAEVFLAELIGLARGLHGPQWRSEPCELAGKRITIIGLGDLGSSIATLAAAFGAHISYVSRRKRESSYQFGTKQELLPCAEIVILTGPTDTEVLSAADFDLFPPGVILVQASAGLTFDETAFLSWIQRPENFAVFDLCLGEDRYERYSKLPGVIFPHLIAGYSVETKQRLGAAVLTHVKRLTS